MIQYFVIGSFLFFVAMKVMNPLFQLYYGFMLIGKSWKLEHLSVVCDYTMMYQDQDRDLTWLLFLCVSLSMVYSLVHSQNERLAYTTKIKAFILDDISIWSTSSNI